LIPLIGVGGGGGCIGRWQFGAFCTSQSRRRCSL
jgi:hypothetical protein